MRYALAILAMLAFVSPAFAGGNHHHGGGGVPKSAAEAANDRISQYEANHCPCDARTQAKLDAWRATNDRIIAGH